jgi:hypothetical protein
MAKAAMGFAGAERCAGVGIDDLAESRLVFRQDVRLQLVAKAPFDRYFEQALNEPAIQVWQARLRDRAELHHGKHRLAAHALIQK